MNNQVTVFPNKAKHLLGMRLASLCHTKMLLEMLSLGYQVLQSPISCSSSFPLNLNSDSWVIVFPQLFCSLLLHSEGSLTHRCPHIKPAPTCFGLPKETGNSDHENSRTCWSEQQNNFGWGAEYSFEKERSKPSSFSATNKGQRARQSNTNPT